MRATANLRGLAWTTAATLVAFALGDVTQATATNFVDACDCATIAESVVQHLSIAHCAHHGPELHVVNPLKRPGFPFRQ